MIFTICACASRSFIDKNKIARLAAIVDSMGHDVRIIGDLCEMCADRVEEVHEIAKSTVIACYPRAVIAQMDYVGECPSSVIDMRSQELEAIVKQISGDDSFDVDSIDVSDAKIKSYLDKIMTFPRRHGDDAWNPVIDKSRCSECGKCFEFCPFGVYEKIDGKVQVCHPHKCKNNCPSCSRLCPKTAIIFPKYEKSPINGGVTMEEMVPVDTRGLYGDALRQKLANRREGIGLLKK